MRTDEEGKDNEGGAACTLDTGRLRRRVDWIVGLNARALKAVRRDGLCLELDYDLGALADVRRLIAQEEDCCVFLRFELTPSSNMLTLTVTGPDTAREATSMMFDLLQGGRSPPGSCGCATVCSL